MKNRDPQIETDFCPEFFLSVTGDQATLYENIYFSDTLFARAVFVSRIGLFVVIPGREVKESDCVRLVECLGISFQELYVFLYAEGVCDLLHAGERAAPDDIYEAFENLFTNLSRPYVDRHYLSFRSMEELIMPAKRPAVYENEALTDSFVVDGITYETKDSYRFVDTGENRAALDAIDSASVERIQKILLSMENNDFPDPKKKTMWVGEQEYIKKQTAKRIAGISTAFIGKEDWFPLSPENTTGIMAKTALFGWAGWHKFHFGELPGGIFYLLTGGCLGILPAMDILSMTLGNASYTVTFYEEGNELTQQKERVFLKAPSHRVFGFAAMGAALLIGFLVFRFGYLNLLKLIGNALPRLANTHPELFSGMIDTSF